MEKKKRTLRGKKTRLKDFKENFTKVPNIILHAKGLAAFEKLLLIELQSYSLRPNWVLAYTRMANDLDLDRGTLMDRWHGLIEKGYIIVDDRYSINYDLLTDTPNDSLNGSKAKPKSRTKSSKDEVGKTHLLSKEGSQHPPEQGSLEQPVLVGINHLNGSPAPPIEEENKEEEIQTKNKEQEEFLVLMKKEFKENESDEPLDVILSDCTKESDAELIKSNSIHIENQKPQINSYEDFKKFFNDNQLRELSSKSQWGIVQATDYLFSNAQYDLQTSIATQLKREYNYPQLDPSKSRSKTSQPTGSSSQDAYDFLPWG